MKTLISKPTILFICALLLCFNYVYSQNDTILTIPFVERFTEGSLEVNNWTKESDNWSINIENGQPKPSVRFNGEPAIGGIYSYSLTSDWITTINSGITPSIALKFDIHKQFNISSVNECLSIEIYDSTQWITLDELYQFDSISATKYYYIQSYITKEHFRIRFRVSGVNSKPGEYWEIDNIQVYRRCTSPENLSGSYYWDENNFGVELLWEDNHSLACPTALTWCFYDGTISGVGIDDTSPEWSWAAKWLPSQMWGDSMTLYSVCGYFYDNQFDSVVLNIWQGDNGDNLIYSNKITNPITAEDYNYVFLDPPLILRDTSSLFVGYTVYEQEPNTFPAGILIPETTEGFGNLVKLGDTANWDTLSNYGLMGNWCIYLYLYDALHISHKGYNMYRSEGDDSNYTLYDFIETQGYTYNSWYDTLNIDMQTPYWYKITNVYKNYSIVPPVTYESLPATVNNSDDDFVMVFVTGENENIRNNNNVTIFPNPGNTFINIKTIDEIESVSIYTLNGELLFERNSINKKLVKYDVSNFEAGVYLIKIKDKVRVNTKKIVIQ